MRVVVSTILSCSANLAWAEVQSSRLLCEVAWPLVTFRPVDGATFPERWQAGMEVRCRSRLLGILPLGARHLRFDEVDDKARTIRTHEHDALVQRWDHVIRVDAVSDDSGRTLYSDEIEIQAGALTPLVALFARVFYRHRQRRWRRVAKRLSHGQPSRTHS
jgi:hypothetical protein